jgi:hypothetical protein
VDEGQDCLEDEKQILKGIYGIKKMVISDGMQQLIRTQENCNWRSDILETDLYFSRFTNSMRMKRNIALFTNGLSKKLGLKKWKVNIDKGKKGGAVIVIEGNYFESNKLHDNIKKKAYELGNKDIDMLVCVPPSYVRMDDDNQSHIKKGFSKFNQEIWDGTDKKERKTYPTSVEQLRVVQYDSCRGLEGWTSINIAFDEFYEYKKDTFKTNFSSKNKASLSNDDEKIFLARWMMIPLTRAMDTLVINVSREDSLIKNHLKELAEGSCKDFIHWYN